MLYRLLILASLALSTAASAQEPLRTLFSPNSFVRSAAIADDTLYVGGDFTAVGPPTGHAVVIDPATGQPDLSQARVDGQVEVILPDGSGGWYVGGETNFAGGQLRRNLAHVLADGSLDADFAPDPMTSDGFGRVQALALSPDGQTLYVGGRFDTVGGQPRIDLAAVDAETGAVFPFRADLTPIFDFIDVQALLVVPYADGSGAALYVGGEYTAVNGVPRASIAAVDATTGAVLPWNPEPETDGDFLIAGQFELGTPPATGQPGTLYVSGSYDRFRGQPCDSGPAELTLAEPETGEGGAPTGFCVNSGFDDMVVAGDAIFVADDFSNRVVIRRIDRATGAVTPFFGGAPYGMSNGGGPRAIAYDPVGGSGGGVLYVNTGIDGDRPVGRGSVVLGVDAVTGQRVGPEIPIANERTGLGVIEIAVEPGGRVFAGGDDFASVGVGSEERRFLAGFDLTIGDLVPFGDGFVVFSSVEEMAMSPDERTLYFTTFNGIGVADLTTGEISTFPTGRSGTSISDAETADDGRVRSGAPDGAIGARADGRPLAPFAPPARKASSRATEGGTSRVRTNGSALAVTDDRLYVHFTGGTIAYDRDTADEIWVTPFSAFSADPTSEEILLIEAGPPGAAGDTLFVAGSILSADGQPRGRFAALDAETGAVLDWNVNPVQEPNGTGKTVAALGPGEDGGPARVYLGGSGLTEIGGQPRRNAAAADRTTGALAPWAPEPTSAGVFSLAAQAGPSGGVSGGVVYVGGTFNGIAGTDQMLAAAVDAETGALIEGWVPAPVGGRVQSVLLAERQGRVVLSGLFTNSTRGSGHAFVTALTPARPFAVASEPGTGDVSSGLSLAGPNPVRGRTALAVTLPTAQVVEAALYDVLGRRVAVLHEGVLPAGTSRIEVAGEGLPAGVYVARVTGAGFAEAVRLTVVR